jgi:outer membrane protein assembly factor BamB
MKKRFLIICVFFLLVVSTLGSLSFGYKLYEKNSILENYDSYNEEEVFGYSPILNYKDDSFESNKTNIVNEPSKPLNGPPMDSPWPMYGHDVRHTGRSPYSTADNSFYNKWWIKSGYYIEGSGAIDKDGVIYFCYAERDVFVDFYYVAAYPNGTLKWKLLIDVIIRAPPAIDEDGTIYVGIYHPWEGLIAINPNGTIKWRYVYGCVLSSPAIGGDDTIYYSVQSSNNPPKGAVIALYPNGTLKWRYNTNHVIYSSPTIGDDETVYCGCHDEYLYALYPNGSLKWKYKTGHWVRAHPCIGDDGTIYCVSLDNYLHAVNPNGTIKWKTNVGAGTSPTIGQDGTIYAGYRTLHAVNPVNGSVKWTFPVGAGAMRGGTPCNSVDGTIFVGTSDGGELIAIDSDGTLRWRTKIGTCEFAPIIGEDGTVYVGTSVLQEDYLGAYSDAGYLYAFNNMDPNAPKAPEINGPNKGKIGIEYPYSFKSASPMGRNLYYYIEWGDHDFTTQWWIGPYNSSETIVLNHTWPNKDKYTIKVRCKDTENLWGPFSEYIVSITPRNKAVYYSSFFISFLERFPNAFTILRYIVRGR